MTKNLTRSISLSSQRGFTLLSLIFSLFLTSLLTLYFKPTAQTIQIRRTARSLAHLLEELSLEAIVTTRRVTIKCNSASGELLRLAASPTEEPRKILRLPKGAKLSSCRFGNLGSGSNGQIIEFHPDGATSAGRITITTGSDSCSVIQSIYAAARVVCS